MKAFVSIAHMLESTLFAAYNSYRAIKSVGSQLRSFKGHMRGMLRTKLYVLWYCLRVVARFLRYLHIPCGPLERILDAVCGGDDEGDGMGSLIDEGIGVGELSPPRSRSVW